MGISPFDEEYADYMKPEVLRARPLGNFAASMIGGVAILILGVASNFVPQNFSEQKIATATAEAPAQCEPRTIFEGRTARNDAGLRATDLSQLRRLGRSLFDRA